MTHHNLTLRPSIRKASQCYSQKVFSQGKNQGMHQNSNTTWIYELRVLQTRGIASNQMPRRFVVNIIPTITSITKHGLDLKHSALVLNGTQYLHKVSVRKGVSNSYITLIQQVGGFLPFDMAVCQTLCCFIFTSGTVRVPGGRKE